jgi:hypothetical protein
MIKDPEISKHLIISTIHISPNDVELLRIFDRNGQGIVADEYPYGYRVHCFIEDGLHDVIKTNLIEKGFSKEFVAIMFIAHELECDWVDFDQDGPEYPELFQFEW